MTPMSHVLSGMAATGAIMLTDALPDFGSDAVGAVERLGLAIALVLFFVYTGWKREQRMGARIDTLERQVATLAKSNASIAEQSAQALREETRMVADAIKTLAGRTCFAFESREEFEKHQREFSTE